MVFVIPSLILSFVIVAVVKLNLWDRRESSKLSKAQLKELDEEIRREDSIW